VFSRLQRSLSSARRTVCEDWIAALPGEKLRLFQDVVREWEFTHAMMSVALDEALTLRTRGELICARQQVSVATDLLARLAATLVATSDVVSNRGRYVPHLPQVEPLKTEFFRGETGQNAAHWNLFLHHVLFADRSRFFQKLRILSDTIERIVHEFDDTAEDIMHGVSIQPVNGWDKLECLQFDFNTCLCESEVVLKSFLRALPADQLPALMIELDKLPAAKRVDQRRRARLRLSRASA